MAANERKHKERTRQKRHDQCNKKATQAAVVVPSPQPSKKLTVNSLDDQRKKDVTDDDTFIARNVQITIKVIEKGLNQVVDFRVLGIYTKHYNKWYLCEHGWQPWSKEKSGNYKVYTKMVSHDPTFGSYSCRPN